MTENNLSEYRCPCGKLLFKASLKEGSVEGKCRACHKVTIFTAPEAASEDSSVY